LGQRLQIEFVNKSQFGLNWAKVSCRNRAQFLLARHSLFTPRGGHEVKVSQWLAEILMVGSGGGG
jgi:hypothetical protein